MPRRWRTGPTPRDDGRLPPGLYEQLVSLGLGRRLRELDTQRLEALTGTPESTERPRLLARYLHGLLFLALGAQSGQGAEAKQLALCRRLLETLAEAESGVLAEDALEEPTRMLTAVVDTQGLGTSPRERAAIPLRMPSG